ncbi:extracellular solute-binding protein [Lentzea sp. NPDC006480]|uniref:extracellular solute-binding protein n=1 Tax=Lentzea sp. NPDC006480 TaxID=3157176 RepID=UPI0033ADB842
MSARRRGRGRWAVVVVALLAAGCATGGGRGEITITVATFGDFGYQQLFREYEAQHPGVRLQPRISEFDPHHKSLVTQLAAGKGAADVVAVEEGYMPQLRQSFDKFVNLADLGARDLQSRYVSWKWEQGLADSGKVVMGLGTDMGSLAMCYRKDYFQAAGLPTDRTQVAKLWPTWEQYERTADRFAQAKPDVKFADSSASIYTAMLNQSEEGYFARADDSFIGDRNSNLKRAFDTAARLGTKGQTARVSPFTQPWTVAIQQGSFATMPCPAWMLTLVKNAGGDQNRGKWDVTTVPEGGGNQGGSFLTVPRQGQHTREAYDVAAFLTAPEQEKRIFLDTGSLPSEPSIYQDPGVVGKTDDYFSGAPVGKLFASAADGLHPSYRGLRDSVVRPIFGAALGRAESGAQPPQEAFMQAVTEAKTALK